MNFNILRSLQFEKELKRLIKKYPSLKKEYENLISSLEKIQPKALQSAKTATRSVSQSLLKGKENPAEPESFLASFS
ncbi:hypothetical protein LEP1GSC112_4401 [Leptospira interrogans serovar Pomona str. UT364]|nr:hypothetical protein LEP1GSC112_4401 [Leptospira interrogans serovar Pomona str. UT364]